MDRTKIVYEQEKKINRSETKIKVRNKGLQKGICAKSGETGGISRMETLTIKFRLYSNYLNSLLNLAINDS